MLAVRVDLGEMRQRLALPRLVLDDVALRLLVTLLLDHAVGLLARSGATLRIVAPGALALLGVVALGLLALAARSLALGRLIRLLLNSFLLALLGRCSVILALVLVLGLLDDLVDLVPLARVGRAGDGLGGGALVARFHLGVVRASADHGDSCVRVGASEWEEEERRRRAGGRR